jgi:glutaminyl-peptide cyclotransferase
VVPATGEVEARVDLDAAHFGEGLARVPGSAGDRLVQLTWRAGTALVWNLADLSAAGTFTYSGEGWGLCYDSVGQRLVMSDGSSRLTFRDPQTFATTGDIGVTRDGSPLSRLNELECVGGHVWSNVWLTDDIVEIDPNSGVVLTVVDAASLRPAANAGDDDVLNGIAYDATTGHYLVTGKRWPKLFEVEWVAGDEPGTTPRSGAGRPNLGCGAALPGLGWFGIALLVRAAVRRRRRAKPSCGSTSPVASV